MEAMATNERGSVLVQTIQHARCGNHMSTTVGHKNGRAIRSERRGVVVYGRGTVPSSIALAQTCWDGEMNWKMLQSACGRCAIEGLMRGGQLGGDIDHEIRYWPGGVALSRGFPCDRLMTNWRQRRLWEKR